MKNLPETFCLVPWTSIEVKHNNLCSVCCMHKENITMDNGEVADLSKHSLNEILNSNYIKKIKEDFLSGAKIDSCSPCWTQESKELISRRKLYAEQMRQHVYDIGDSSELLYLDLKMGRARYKRTVSSLVDISAVELPKNDQYWENIFKIIPTLEEIDFIGDCFNYPEHDKLINFIIDSEYADQIVLHYKANGSKSVDHLINKWRLFKKVRVTVSLYDIEENFSSEWYECQWDDFVKNLNNMFEFKKNNGQFELCFVLTVDDNNRHRKNLIQEWIHQYPFTTIVINEQ